MMKKKQWQPTFFNVSHAVHSGEQFLPKISLLFSILSHNRFCYN